MIQNTRNARVDHRAVVWSPNLELSYQPLAPNLRIQQQKIKKMKASLKLREDDDRKPPLLRAKLPISVFNLPFVTSVAAGDTSDLSFHLLASSPIPYLPSLKLSYHPFPNPNPNPNPSSFSLTLKSAIPHFGRIAFRVSPNPNPTFFSVHLKPQLGHFSITNRSPSGNPNPKENGGGVHHPIPVSPELVGGGGGGGGGGGVGVNVRTVVPVGRRAGVKVRWAVRLPEVRGSSGVWGRLPYLSVDKISVERIEEEEEERDGEVKGNVREWSEKDVEAMRGMCFWMEREVEELRREREKMKASIEVVKQRVLEWQLNNEKEGRRKHLAAAGRRA